MISLPLLFPIFLAFFCAFSFVSKTFKGSAKRKTKKLCVCVFFICLSKNNKKKQGLEGQGSPRDQGKAPWPACADRPGFIVPGAPGAPAPGFV